MKTLLILSIVFTLNFARQAPPQAISACKHSSSNNQCSFNSHHGKITGLCRKIQNNMLACVPSHHGNNPQRQSSAKKQQGQRHTRAHTTNQSSNTAKTIPANTNPIASNRIYVYIQGNVRVLESNGISKHKTGAFPNQSNPNPITEQDYSFKVPAYPKLATSITPLGMHDFGLGINGVPFDPGAAEWYKGIRGSKWQYEALSGAVRLGLDENHAHVQPTGAYHYHGVPKLLLEGLDINSNEHSPIIGWAADGFPIYALYGYSNPKNTNSEIIEMQSSFTLRSGDRESSSTSPGGHFDGTFVNDYIYTSGKGTLDECNGRYTITPEFPNGTYAYFISDSFPVIPRCYKGTPSTDFTQSRRRR